MEFHWVKMGGRPLLAVPASLNRHLRAEAIGCYPAHTWKKRWVRVAVRAASRWGVLPRIFPVRNVPLPGVAEEEFGGWMNAMRQRLDRPDLHPVLVWPADPARGRIYVYLLDAGGRKVGFCKLSLDARNNDLIEREGEALARLHALGLSLSRIPAVLANGELGGNRYLVVETTPGTARITDWKRDASLNEAIAEFAGPVRRIPAGGVASLAWWAGIQRCFSDSALFLSKIEEAAKDGIDVCRSHGDLNQTNVLRDGNEVWLLDWEQSREDAPCLTDSVCVAVDRLWTDQPASPGANFFKFKQEFLSEDDAAACARAVLALAFLGAAGFTPALAMIREWCPSR